MTEETIFACALAKSTPAERIAYLDEVCANDAALRNRVEALLASHFDSGGFLETPAIERAAEEVFGQRCSEDAQGKQPGDDDDANSLAFLGPSEKSGSLGRLGHYEVSGVIGRGGMGVVLRALDERLQRIVAIKVMAPVLAASANARQRFVREAQAAAAVRNDHVVNVYAVEEVKGLPYLVMECISGVSLQERLDRDGPLDVKEILRIGMQMAAGLAAAHAQGLIHRDIKPANILLENGVERVKITDFGLARAVDDVRFTQTGILAGTPPYMAPEQARGDAVDHRADLFSLGSVLYAMCTGRPPFRASTTMGILRRVSDDTARPIRELNADIPDWLVTVIDKLHAKNPVERFQSAAEVAELLSRHLAEVQHPSIAPAGIALRAGRDTGRNITGGTNYNRRRRWAVAALVLLCLGAGLGLTEATGTTQLTATVIRIFTPSGTLVVETDDSSVNVTIEGDGGIVITGAGPQEVRVRPGNYQVKAMKEGRPVTLDRNLVSISRGDKQVVRVRLEGELPLASPATVELGAFVLLGGKDVAERKFDTLANAVLGASDGDTIEIRGNGPFVTEPIRLKKALTMRAGEKFQPTLQLDARLAEPLLFTEGSMVLEGIEFLHQEGNDAALKRWLPTLFASGPALAVANCRFVRQATVAAPSVYCDRVTRAQFRNSQFTRLGGTPGSGIGYRCPPSGTLLVENCADSASFPLTLTVDTKNGEHVTIRLRNNTWTARRGIHLILSGISGPIPESRPADAPLVIMESAQNVFDFGNLFVQVNDSELTTAPPPKEILMDACRRIFRWRDEDSLYPSQVLLGVEGIKGEHIAVNGQTAWDQFWSLPPTAARSGTPKFQGGDIYALNLTRAQALGPEAFRLRPDSPGYRAGKDGKDLGAEVDLVGPGAAYERWKKTPEYQEWLKDSGQEK